MKVIINVNDGSVVELEGSYLVDITELTGADKELWHEWVEFGSGRYAKQIAVSAGTLLTEII